MKAFDDLVTLALLGTARHSGPLPPMPADVAAVTDPSSAAGDPAPKLADALAVLSSYTRAGSLPVPAPPALEPCPADSWPPCSDRAAAVLARLLTTGPRDLIPEWLQAARQVQRRPPHQLLPKLLDLAAGNRQLRPAVEAVMDARGAWLARLHPRWQFAQQPSGNVEEIWQTGQRDQRQAVLLELRRHEPARARELLQSTWAQEPADDRLRWLGLLTTGLSPADEPFLEACLDDRGSRVREAAGDLLARLPTSHLVRRLTERLEPMLVFKAGRQPTLDVALPEKFDPGWTRDGIAEQPAKKVGKKEWWFTQMLMRVPPRHWSERFQLEPAKLLALLPEDYREAMVRAWLLALDRHPDDTWGQAMLDCVQAFPAKKRVELLPLLPARTLLANLATLLKDDLMDDEVVDRLLRGEGTFTPAACEALALWLVESHKQQPWHLSALLNRLALLVPPTTLPLFHRYWTLESLGERFRYCDGFFTFLQLRHDMHMELGS